MAIIYLTKQSGLPHKGGTGATTMNLTLISTELTEETIQVTYTDGQPVDNAKQALTLRGSFEGDLKKSILWNQMQLMQQLAEWSSAELSSPPQ
jgi:hypothetical protein